MSKYFYLIYSWYPTILFDIFMVPKYFYLMYSWYLNILFDIFMVPKHEKSSGSVWTWE